MKLLRNRTRYGRQNGWSTGALILTLFLSLLVFKPGFAQIVTDQIPELQNIDVVEHLGDTIPQHLTFINDRGQELPLSNYLHRGRPLMLILAYYNCPMLCTLILNGITQAIYNVDLKLGRDYEILTVSIDPAETVELAAAKKRTHLNMLNQSVPDSGWTFFVGREEEIKMLADAVGFKYYYIPDRQEFAHPAVILLLSEEGKITRYLYGIEYKPLDVKLGLLEAAQGKVGSTIDRLILYCFHYDPNAGGYVVLAANIMKLGGALTLGLILVFLGVLWIRELRRKTTTISNN